MKSARMEYIILRKIRQRHFRFPPPSSLGKKGLKLNFKLTAIGHKTVKLPEACF